jgi:ssDNA-binding Zn-finger/Zn-ribbon topoisomerase 1
MTVNALEYSHLAAYHLHFLIYIGEPDIRSAYDVTAIVAAIKTGMLPKSWKTRREHVQKLDQRFSSATVCPKCGCELVLRTARSGNNAGGKFYGCSSFPTCRYVRTAQP